MKETITDTFGCLIPIFIFYIIPSIISGFCWDYSLNKMLPYLNYEPIEFYKSMLLGFIPGLGEVSILLSIIVWIISL